MSHTITVETKCFGEVRVHHNSDWSGLAMIEYEQPSRQISTKPGNRPRILKPKAVRVYVPARIFIEVAKTHLVNTLASLIERQAGL